MRIGIIDADLISRKKHRFPNLACMKISAYHKEQGHDVQLVTNYKDLYYDENLWVDYQNAINAYIKKQSKKHSEQLGKCMVPCFDKSNMKFDKIFISKVFTDTEIDEDFLTLDIVEYGGTGFFFDKAPNLPDEIEHHFPDYHLYDDFVNSHIEAGAKRVDFKEYLDYSIGFVTRGCFRKCGFCVNKKYDRVFQHSPLSEFYDPSRPKICLLDDNFFGYPGWKDTLLELQATGKPFKFKQGLDERLLTDEKCELLCQSKYDGSITFAFDNIADYKIIEKKLAMIREHTQKQFTFYVLCAYESQDEVDIENVFIRIRLLMQYKCIPYIMRFEKYNDSPHRGIYITLARWCNQPSFFKKKSFRQYTEFAGGSAERYMREFEEKHPDMAAKYFDMRWDDFNQ